MIIKGANLGDYEGELRRLTEHNFDLDEEAIKTLRYLERLFLSIQEQSKTTYVHEFPSVEKKVLLNEGMINHKCTGDIKCLESMSQNGILASEWFGILESEQEGRFCTFIDRLKPDNYVSLNNNINRIKGLGDGIVLFFDMDNELMQYLLHLDYFEYEKIKNEHPEKLTEIYKPEEIEIFDKLIEPLSKSGIKFHYESKKNTYTYYWSAIPGGIPSILVNGICLRSQEYDENYIKELIKLFPNATIFNKDLTIIYKPQKDIQDNIKIDI